MCSVGEGGGGGGEGEGGGRRGKGEGGAGGGEGEGGEERGREGQGEGKGREEGGEERGMGETDNMEMRGRNMLIYYCIDFGTNSVIALRSAYVCTKCVTFEIA